MSMISMVNQADLVIIVVMAFALGILVGWAAMHRNEQNDFINKS